MKKIINFLTLSTFAISASVAPLLIKSNDEYLISEYSQEESYSSNQTYLNNSNVTNIETTDVSTYYYNCGQSPSGEDVTLYNTYYGDETSIAFYDVKDSNGNVKAEVDESSKTKLLRYDNNQSYIEVYSYKFDSYSSYYGYYVLEFVVYGHGQPNGGVGWSYVDLNTVQIYIRDATLNTTYYYLNAESSCGDGQGDSHSSFNKTKSLMIMPGSYNIDWFVEIDVNSDFVYGSDFDGNSTITLPQYNYLPSSFTSSNEISSYFTNQTYYYTSQMSRVLEVVNEQIYNDMLYYNGVTGSQSNVMSRNNVYIEFIDSSSGLTIHKGTISEKSSTSLAPERMDIIITHGSNIYRYDDVSISSYGLYIQQETIVSTTPTSVNISIPVSNETLVNTIEYSTTDGIWLPVTKDGINDNVLNLTITGLIPDYTYTNMKIRINSTSDSMLIQPFTTASSQTGDTTGEVATNTVSPTGSSTVVRVNYANEVSSQNIEYSIDGGTTWNVATVIDSSGYYDEFAITGLTPNTYYDLEIKIDNKLVTTQVNDIYTANTETIFYSYSIESQTYTDITLLIQDGLVDHINQFNFYYKINGSDYVLIQDATEGDATIEFRITNLNPGTTYNLEIFVENKDEGNAGSTFKIKQDHTITFTTLT